MTETKTKILIVEDDPLMLRIYSKVFDIEGFAVATAMDGEEGLLQVRKEIPTLIVLDAMMPKMNGLQLLEILKADPTTKEIPVIMLTNLAGQADAETAIAKGAIKYIIKSEHDPKQVVEIVRGVLDRSSHNLIPETAH